ncbi:YraN family protein [Massiliimalia massiliensis]|uniref:YraN family protein n=1 Tax=Massiliimalia massiliensis TaxID=1852384 RepID=UPI001E65E012|nr:YraN family protein [Massiliimalia massiliensis]
MLCAEAGGYSRKKVGTAGENLACKYLRQHGWRIVRRNFTAAYGEIDIIAERGTVLAFIEVKTRAYGSLYAAQDAVTPKKQERLCQTAALYLAEHPASLQPRFDVCEIYFTEDRRALIRYLENAFQDRNDSGQSNI